MKLPTDLLLAYQAEYEHNQDCTIDSLCAKYDIQPHQLVNHQDWTKQAIVPTEVITSTPPSISSKEAILRDIDEFKELAVAHANAFMKNDAEFADVKEFKDMVAIVDSLEKSYKDKQDGTTINVLIQNLNQKFKDTPDDC